MSTPQVGETQNESIPTPSGPQLLVAGPDGVRVLDLDGRVLEQRSNTPAVAIRHLPGKRTAVVLGEDGVLRLLDEAGGETRLAALPLDPPCPAGASSGSDFEADPLGLRSDEEMWISEDGSSVCIWVSDHPHDMRSNLREVAVRFSNGSLTQELTLGGSECGVPEGPGLMAPCGFPPIGNTDEALPSPVGGLTVSASPDGAWSLVMVGSMLGDLLHLQYVLVRNTDHTVFELRQSGGPWPESTTLPGTPEPDALLPGLPDVIAGETEAWVGPHHLVLDQMLYIAGERVVDLGGDLAPP
ncbi:MAG: hypothetical protein ACRBN8_44000 [Nannocystales bacterium]